MPTLTNGGIILLGLAFLAALFVWRYFRNADNLIGYRCRYCGELIHPRDAERSHWCSEYCRTSWQRESR